MELRQLRHFAAVAEELHFGRAAERLGMTQPPLSQSIRALEAELGVQLFSRTRRRVALTALGREWLPHAAKVLNDAASLPDRARRLSRGEVGTISLAFVSFAAYSFLPRLVSRYKQSFPEVEIVLSEATSDVQVDGLLGGSLDAGLIIAPPRRSVPAGLQYMPVTSEPLVAAVPTRWIEDGLVAAGGGTVRFASLKEKPLILFPRASAPALHDLVIRYYAEHHATPVMGQQAIQMQTIINLVSEGLGIALVPSSMRVLAPAGVSYLRLGRRAPVTEVGLAWKPETCSTALANLLDLVRAMVPEI